MAWTIEYADAARRSLKGLDKQAARRIVLYMETRVAASGNPRRFGKALSGPLGDRWRYRVGEYRVVCDIQDAAIRVLVLAVGHRSVIYRRK